MKAFRRAGRVLFAGAVVLATVVVSAPPALADSVRDDQWWIKSLKLAEAHRITKGDGVVVAVIDTGVWAGHPDLKGALVPGSDFTSGKTVKNGYVDLDGHGTSVTGLIVARGRSGGRGLLGIAPQAKVMPLRTKVAGDYGGHPGRSLRYAIEHGADVVNISLGTGDGWEVREAVRAAAEADVVVVAASGNNAVSGINSTEPVYPAAYPGVVGVGAVGRDGKLTKLSVTGPHVDLTAPGDDMVLAYRDNGSGYVDSGGTSYSSAIVAGAAALVRAKFPELSAAEVVHRLQATAVDKGAPGVDPEYGHGVIDIVAALTKDVPPLAVTPSAAPTNGTPAASRPSSPETSNVGLIALAVGCVGAFALVGAGLLIWLVRRRRAVSG